MTPVLARPPEPRSTRLWPKSLPTGYVGGDSDMEAYVALQRTTAPYPADAKPGMIGIMASTPPSTVQDRSPERGPWR